MTIALSTATDTDLVAALAECGEPGWRVEQLRDATWQPFIDGFDDVRQLPAATRVGLAQAVRFSTVAIATESTADGGRTLKLLCRLDDGQTVESVAMETPARARSRRRATVCVSSQVGCAVGCPFCATGHMGLRRSCTSAEIVDQVRAASRALHGHGLGTVTHVVYMGMGEPLANVDATLESLRVLTTSGGVRARRITVSTSGSIPGIDALTASSLPVTLAISLHAATDAVRDRLVPMNRAYPVADLVRAGMRFVAATGRRLSFEWCLIGGINDGVEQARALRTVARECNAHVNVIPMNRIAGSAWGPPDPAVARRFLGELAGVNVTVRDTRGAGVDAACGQLRADLEARRVLGPDGRLRPQVPTVVS